MRTPGLEPFGVCVPLRPKSLEFVISTPKLEYPATDRILSARSALETGKTSSRQFRSNVYRSGKCGDYLLTVSRGGDKKKAETG